MYKLNFINTKARLSKKALPFYIVKKDQNRIDRHLKTTYTCCIIKQMGEKGICYEYFF